MPVEKGMCREGHMAEDVKRWLELVDTRGEKQRAAGLPRWDMLQSRRTDTKPLFLAEACCSLDRSLPRGHSPRGLVQTHLSQWWEVEEPLLRHKLRERYKMRERDEWGGWVGSTQDCNSIQQSTCRRRAIGWGIMPCATAS